MRELNITSLERQGNTHAYKCGSLIIKVEKKTGVGYCKIAVLPMNGAHIKWLCFRQPPKRRSCSYGNAVIPFMSKSKVPLLKMNLIQNNTATHQKTRKSRPRGVDVALHDFYAQTRSWTMTVNRAGGNATLRAESLLDLRYNILEVFNGCQEAR